MARSHAEAAMEMRQQSYGESLPSSSDLAPSTLTSSFFDSSSFGGSATLIPPSCGVVPADEWSGTSITGPGPHKLVQAPALKRGLHVVKSEYPDLKRPKSEHTHLEAFESVHQDGSLASAPGFEGAPTSSQLSGLETDVRAGRGSLQSGEITSPQSVYHTGHAPTQERGQTRAHSVQSLRSFHGDIQPVDDVSSELGNASHLAHFQRSPSVNHLSAYQAQLQAEAMAQAQAANQQAVILQARQGTEPQQQQQQQQQFQSGQAQAFQVANGRPFCGAAQQMIARMQPGMQSQILQGLRLGNRHLILNPGPGAGNLRTRTLESGYRSRMPPSVVSKCTHTIMLYVQEQKRRPPDNNISFWQKLVHTFFEPGALQRWCLSSYNTSPVGRHAQGLFPMEFWFCNLCGVQPGRGFESCTDVLPRLLKIKYDSGLLDELLFLDMAEEYILPSGKMVLEYSGVVHESIFPEIRVRLGRRCALEIDDILWKRILDMCVRAGWNTDSGDDEAWQVIRYGTLRVTFSPSFKIQAWEFCTKTHEELVPYKNLLEQTQQLENLVVEAEQEDFNKSVENLTKHCNAFMATARQLAVKLDAPLVNDLGFAKRYVRCLQISEVVNSMKDLISFERKTRLGPLQSLAEFPSARKLQQQGLLSTHPSLTALIHHFTRGAQVHPDVSKAAPFSNQTMQPPSPQAQGQVHLQLHHGHALSKLQGLHQVSGGRASPSFHPHQQVLHSFPKQVHSRSLSLTPHPSLPNTPQSGISDPRSNAS